MTLKSILAAATAAVALTFVAAAAEPYGPPQARDLNGSFSQRDPSSYYSQTDQNGYYDRNGHYQPMAGQYGQRDDRGNFGLGPGANADAY